MKDFLRLRSIKTRLIFSTFIVVILVTVLNGVYQEIHLRKLTITDLEPVGNYAVKIRFADGHDTGLFSWGYLHELGVSRDARWEKYLQDLRDKGLERG